MVNIYLTKYACLMFIKNIKSIGFHSINYIFYAY